MTKFVAPKRSRNIGAMLAKVVMLVLGVVVGVFATAVLLDRPEVLAQGWDAIRNLLSGAGSRNDGFPMIVAGLVGILAAVFGVYVMLRSSALFGILIGAFLWIPFGNHFMAQVPEIEESFPDLRANLEGLLAERPRLLSVRNWAETRLPLATEDGTQAQGQDGLRRLPQITDEGVE